MNRKLKSIWNDPVWSQIIAQTLFSVFGLLLFSLYKSIYDNENLFSSLIGFLTFNVELWVMIILLIALIVFQFLFSKFRFGNDLDPKKYDIRITNLKNNSKIERIEHVEGSFRFLPKNGRIRLYVLIENNTECYIGTYKVIIDFSKKTWSSSKVYFGSVAQSVESFYLIVALESTMTDHWIHFGEEVSKRADLWLPFEYPLPDTIMECQKIKVHRIR